jgi:hypothetical protein
MERVQLKTDWRGSPLRRRIEAACELTGRSQDELTVLSKGIDPYRLDTPANHRDGKWVAEQLRIGFGEKSTHWRGLHYSLVMRDRPVRKPDGNLYMNSEEDWIWISETAGKAARWLRYIPFERITDRRNAPPIIHRKPYQPAEAWVDASLGIEFPGNVGPVPAIGVGAFVPRQAYQFVLFGEKASLDEVAIPLAERFEADLYLMTGEISDTLIYRIAADADTDGRPLIVFTLSDFDPAGRQMPVSIARKLQAMRDLFFPALRFEVVPVALTLEQAIELDLPSTPLKRGEKRASRWREAFGREQTEIDALTTPERMDDLRMIIEQAFAPYFDATLERRVERAQATWTTAARRAIDEQVNADQMEEIQDRAEELRTATDDLNSELEEIAEAIELPPIVMPGPTVDDAPRQAPLIGLDQDWVEATAALIAHKSYGG